MKYFLCAHLSKIPFKNLFPSSLSCSFVIYSTREGAAHPFSNTSFCSGRIDDCAITHLRNQLCLRRDSAASGRRVLHTSGSAEPEEGTKRQQTPGQGCAGALRQSSSCFSSAETTGELSAGGFGNLFTGSQNVCRLQRLHLRRALRICLAMGWRSSCCLSVCILVLKDCEGAQPCTRRVFVFLIVSSDGFGRSFALRRGWAYTGSS